MRQRHQRQRQHRQQRQQQSPFAEPITRKTVGKELRAATRLQYRPLEREIHGELRASHQRERQVGNWWDQYLQQVSGSQQQSQAAYDRAAQQQQGFINQASQVDNSNTQRLNKEAAESAALRGATPDNSAAEREAAAQAQRNTLSAAYGGATAAQGANQFAYLADQKRIGSGQKTASRIAEQKRGLSIRQDLRELAKQKGDFRTKYRGELRDKEREYLLKRKATGLERKELGQKARESARDRAQSERQNIRGNRQDEAASRRTAQNNVRSNKQDERASVRSAKNSGGSGQGAREGRRTALHRTQHLVSTYGLPKDKNAYQELLEKVEGTEGVGTAEAEWAVKRVTSRRRNAGANAGTAQGGIHR